MGGLAIGLTAALRLASSRSLGQIGAGAATAIPDLAELVDDADKDSSSLSLRALALIDPNNCLKPKLVEIRDPCPRMRQIAAFALAAMGDDGRDAVPCLASMLKNDDRGTDARNAGTKQGGGVSEVAACSAGCRWPILMPPRRRSTGCASAASSSACAISSATSPNRSKENQTQRLLKRLTDLSYVAALSPFQRPPKQGEKLHRVLNCLSKRICPARFVVRGVAGPPSFTRLIPVAFPSKSSSDSHPGRGLHAGRAQMDWNNS
jgi:hypothetical protein